MGIQSLRANDAHYVLKDAGTRVRAGNDATYGILDSETDPILGAEGGGVLATVHRLTIRTGSLTLSVGSTVEIQNADGTWTEYVVRDRSVFGDGAMTRFWLAEA